MKKLLSLVLISSLMLPTFAWAASTNKKTCPECEMKTNAFTEDKIVRVCNDVSDIICKDVKLDERRACNESDETIFSKATTKEDIFKFAQGCFKSGVTSFVQFFTDFLPQLLRGIWDATKMAAGAVTGDSDVWSKLKGMYESSTSIAADIYEAVQEDPGAYFSKIWSKVVDVVGPMVAGYDCLKPQKKVENICGFIAGWIVPPAVLAKVLVRGVKEVKFLRDHGALSISEKGKLAKALEHAENRPVLTLKQMQELEKSFEKLGYTDDQFEFIYKSGGLQKFKLAELKPITTAEGKAQKLALLGEQKTAAKQTAKNPGQVALKADVSSDFFTTTSTGVNGVVNSSGQIVERIIENGSEVAYRVRMVDPNTKKIIETTFSAEQMARLNAKAANKETTAAITAAIAKDPKLKSPQQEFIELQKKEDARLAAKKAEQDKANGFEVKEVDMLEFERAKAAQVKNYEGGIDYVAEKPPGKIILTKEPPKKPEPPKDPTKPASLYESGYVQVLTKNKMGVTTVMPAQIMKTVVENNVEKYVVRILDKSSNTYIEKKFSALEMTMMRAKDAPAVGNEIKMFDRAAGVTGLD